MLTKMLGTAKSLFASIVLFIDSVILVLFQNNCPEFRNGTLKIAVYFNVFGYSLFATMMAFFLIDALTIRRYRKITYNNCAAQYGIGIITFVALSSIAVAIMYYLNISENISFYSLSSLALIYVVLNATLVITRKFTNYLSKESAK